MIYPLFLVVPEVAYRDYDHGTMVHTLLYHKGNAALYSKHYEIRKIEEDTTNAMIYSNEWFIPKLSYSSCNNCHRNKWGTHSRT